MLRGLPDRTRRAEATKDWTHDDFVRLRWDWPGIARPEQLAPEGDWRFWLFLGGRGAGKTRAGAEWIRAGADRTRGRFALVGPTLLEAREVMVEGPSGLRFIGPKDVRPSFSTTRRRLSWPNGAVGHLFSSEDPDALRGPQFDAAWCDELCAWTYPEATLDMLDLALRRGVSPRAVVTTTPRPIPALMRLMDGPATVVTRARTVDNAAFLSEGFADAVRARVGDGALARQELDGEIVEEIEGALWTRADLDAARAAAPPDIEEIVVAVDPPAGVGPKADACGIVVVGAGGRGRDRRAVVLADATARGLSPLDWAGRVAAQVVSLGATRVVAEANQGGEMVRTVLAAAGVDVPIRLVRAFADKRTRAAPVAALYAQGRIAHAAAFARLEDEMRSFGAPGFSGSPDRLDALVWAVSDLMLERGGGPRVRRL